MMPPVKQHLEKIPLTARQFIKFCIVGVTNTGVDFAAFLLFTRIFDFHYLVANIFAFCISVTNSYLLNRAFTFKSKQSKKTEYASFFAVMVVGLVLAELILSFGVEVLGLGDLYAKAMAIAVVMFWNFFGSKHFAFKVKKDPKTNE